MPTYTVFGLLNADTELTVAAVIEGVHYPADTADGEAESGTQRFATFVEARDPDHAEQLAQDDADADVAAEGH